jgi:hypothetical protein
MLRKLELQILAARYNWCQGPVPGRGPAVEKHCFSWVAMYVNDSTYVAQFYLRWEIVPTKGVDKTETRWMLEGFCPKCVPFMK